MAELTFTIDGQSVTCLEGKTILEAADEAGIYIPRLCHHPDLPALSELIWAESVFQIQSKVNGEKPGESVGEEARCNLCLVEINGQPDPVNSCTTLVENGLAVRTDTESVIQKRKQALSRILSDHPHACLTCAQKQGCSRTDCSTNVPVEERCCVLLGRCELEKVSDYIGIPGDTPRYIPRQLPATKDDPLFERDYGLCIGCLRCVRICEKIQGAGILAAVWKDNAARVGTIAAGQLLDARCRFCGACVEVCPTGALRDKEGAPAVRHDAPLPCVGECPAGIDIPRYIRAIAAGRYREALDIIKARVPFPDILGYICFHPCEDDCRRGKIDGAVAICDLKRFVADALPDYSSTAHEKSADTGRKVAIIGSGPTGATAAYYLRILGHDVSVFDRESKPGGMLRYGIPAYRLPDEVLERQMKMLENLGITFKLDQQLDNARLVDSLKSQGFDAILIAAGASQSKPLNIEGADSSGIHPGLEFLKNARMNQEPRLSGDVVVIGGGNVAIDAAMTARRLGARSVHLVCLECREEMPAHEWEIAQAREEGIEIHTSWGPSRFTSSANRVSGVELKRCTAVFDQQGRFAPQYDEGETTHIAADYVIVTIGQQVDPELLANVGGVAKGPGNTLKAEKNSALRIEGVFAAGDVVRGPSSVVEAIADGRQAADTIDKHLGGTGLQEIDCAVDAIDYLKIDTSSELFVLPRCAAVTAAPDERTTGFGLIQQTLTEQAATAEAHRCLQCQLRQKITPVVLPPELWQQLSQEAVDSAPDTAGVIQLLSAEKKVIRISGTANIRQSLKECLADPGNAAWFGWEEDPMYTKRESELIQQYLQKHGELPSGGGGEDDLDDLF